MKRREFITGLGGAVASPLVAWAQQAKIPVIGFISTASPSLWLARLRAFRQGLSEAGYNEGKNVTIEYRWAENQNDRLPAMATDLVRQKVSVIVANGLAAEASQVATKTKSSFSVESIQSSAGLSLASG